MLRRNTAGAGLLRVQGDLSSSQSSTFHVSRDDAGQRGAQFCVDERLASLRMPAAKITVMWGPASQDAPGKGTNVSGPWMQPDSKLLILVPGATDALLADISNGTVCINSPFVGVGENPYNLQDVVFKLSCPGCAPVNIQGKTEYDTVLGAARVQQCVAAFHYNMEKWFTTGEQVVTCTPSENPKFTFSMKIQTQYSHDPSQAALLARLTGNSGLHTTDGGRFPSMKQSFPASSLPALTIGQIKQELAQSCEKRREAILTHLDRVTGDKCVDMFGQYMIECPMNSFFGLDTLDPTQMDALNSSLAMHLRDRYSIALCGGAQHVVVQARVHLRAGESDEACVHRIYSAPESRVGLISEMRTGLNHWQAVHTQYAPDAAIGAALLVPDDDKKTHMSPWLKTNGEAQNLAGLPTAPTKLFHEAVFQQLSAQIQAAAATTNDTLCTPEGDLTSLGIALNLATAMPGAHQSIFDCEDGASLNVAAERAVTFCTHDELMSYCDRTLAVLMPHSPADHHAIKAVLGGYHKACCEVTDPLCLGLVFAHAGYVGAGGVSRVGAPAETVGGVYHNLTEGRLTEKWAGHAVATAVQINNVQNVTHMQAAVGEGTSNQVLVGERDGPSAGNADQVFVCEIDKTALRFFESTSLTDLLQSDKQHASALTVAGRPADTSSLGEYSPPMKTLRIQPGECRKILQIAEKFNNLRVDEMVAQNVMNEIAATTVSDIYFGRIFEGVHASDPAASTSFYKSMMFAGPCFLVTHEDGLNGLTSAAKQTVSERAANHVRAAIKTTASTTTDESDEINDDQVLQKMLQEALREYMRKGENNATVVPCASAVLAKRPSTANAAQPLGICVPVTEREAFVLAAVAHGVKNMFMTLDSMLESAKRSHLRLMPTASSSMPVCPGASKIFTRQPMTLLGSSTHSEAENIQHELDRRKALALRVNAKGIFNTSSHAWGLVM